MKRTAFISHSSKDRAIGEAVCNFLEQNGITCWIAPRDVTPGKNYGVAIVDAIDECGVFVLILSSESNKSGQVVREVERAASANSVIIPLRIEPVQPSRDLEFYVSSSHWLDATEKPLEKHLNALVDAIRNWQAGGAPQDQVASPTASLVQAPTRGSKLPLIIGGAIVALAIVGLAAFLATRSSPAGRNETSTTASTSSMAQSNAPRMGHHRGGREAAPAQSSAANLATPGAEAATNETAPPTLPEFIERVSASSHRPSGVYMGVIRHFEPNLAFDGNNSTAWISNGSGPGEWIEVFFKSPMTINSVSILGVTALMLTAIR